MSGAASPLFVLTYALPVLAGLALAGLFPVARHMAPPDRRTYAILQIVTLLGAVAGAKVAFLAVELGWPLVAVPWERIAFSGRSITGGLLGGLLAAEAAKPLLGYALPPNDRFACVLPFSVAIGRIGCTLSGCCRGLPHDGLLAIADASGVRRYPAQLLELALQLLAGGLLVVLFRRRLLHGRLFALYLVLYGAGRFALEPIRDTPRIAGPVTGYQVVALLMLGAGAAMLLARRHLGRSAGP